MKPLFGIWPDPGWGFKMDDIDGYGGYADAASEESPGAGSKNSSLVTSFDLF